MRIPRRKRLTPASMGVMQPRRRSHRIYLVSSLRILPTHPAGQGLVSCNSLPFDPFLSSICALLPIISAQRVQNPSKLLHSHNSIMHLFVRSIKHRTPLVRIRQDEGIGGTFLRYLRGRTRVRRRIYPHAFFIPCIILGRQSSKACTYNFLH